MADDRGERRSVRLVPIEASPEALLVMVNGVTYLNTVLIAGCECHPEDTLVIERHHCMS